MTTPVLCESPRGRHPKVRVPRSVLAPHAGCPRGDPAIRGNGSLCLHLFFSIMNLILHVWLSSESIANCQLPISDSS